MNNNIINVYFDANGLPFKDKERTVHYPILGSGLFIGSSRITKIHFFVEQMSDNNAIWIAETKLPNNKHGSQLLTDVEGEEGVCKEMDITGFYTQVKGDVYISLKGYQGGTEASFDTDSQMWIVEGVPISQSTGSVKLSINYAPTGPYPNYNDEFVTYQQILAYLGDKANAIGELPHFNVSGSDYVLSFVLNNNVNGKAIVLYIDGVPYIGRFNRFGNEESSRYSFVLKGVGSTTIFYTGNRTDMENMIFTGLITGDAYKHEYEITDNKVTSITSSSTNTQYPSAKAVETALQTKQDTLASGTNIKTINGESVLGSGNINIQGGGGNAEWGSIGGDITDQSDLQAEFQNVREVAEGKTKSYVLSYSQQAPSSDVLDFRKQDGSSFEDIDDFTNYVGQLELANSIFNSQNDNVETDDSYLIVQGKEYGIYIVMIDLSVFNKGDNIYVTETDVPDRWVDVQGSPQSPTSISTRKLETNKPDFSNYYTKSQTDTEDNKVAHDIAVEYNVNTLYGAGDLCIHEKLLYKCNTANTTGTWDSTKWDLTSVNSELGIIKGDIQHIANKWVGAYVGDETAFNTDMKVGDTLIETTGGQFLINDIAFSGTTLTKVVLVGLEDTGNPVVHKYESGLWSSKNYEPPKEINEINVSDISESDGVYEFTVDQITILSNGKPTLFKGAFAKLENPIAYLRTLSASGYIIGGILIGGINSTYNPNIITNMLIRDNRKTAIQPTDTRALFSFGSTAGGALQIGNLYERFSIWLSRINNISVDGSVFYTQLAAANIGAITTTTIATGWYRNGIAISSGLTNAVDVKVKMSNGAVYPAINNGGSELVIFNGVDFVANSITVTTVYYKTA